MDQYPDIKPVVIGGFGGRECMPHLNRIDTFQIWMVGKLAKESAPWEGLEIWESMVPERVEIFANDVREKILGLTRRTDTANLRWYWNSVQPANRTAAEQAEVHPEKILGAHEHKENLFHPLAHEGRPEPGLLAVKRLGCAKRH